MKNIGIISHFESKTLVIKRKGDALQKKTFTSEFKPKIINISLKMKVYP